MNCLQLEREIDSVLVPKFTLNNGSKMPCIGFVVSSEGELAGSLVKKAILAGYRHIDCASVFGNEKFIGRAIREMIECGQVRRDQLWITSKVWNDMHGDVEQACRKSLSDLQLDYLDLYLVQWPFSNVPKLAGINFEDIGSKPYSHKDYMSTWKQMESLMTTGIVKNIGTSNMTIPKLKMLLKDAKIKPVCNQMEMHPFFQQPELFKYCIKNNIQPVAFCPLGSMVCQEHEKCQFHHSVMEDGTILNIARRLHSTPCQVAIKWAVQRGQVPVTFSLNHFYEHLEAVVKVNLTEDDMKAIAAIDKNSRLIKGQEFLWRSKQSWKDIWDMKGVISK